MLTGASMDYWTLLSRVCLSLSMLIHCVPGQGLTTCTWDSSSCSCETDKGTISLKSLSKDTPYKVEVSAKNENFYWNPCKDFTVEGSGITAGAMQQQIPSTFYDIGIHQNADSDVKEGHARFFMFASDYQRAIYIKCVCKSGFNLQFDKEDPQTEYQFTLSSDSCCPGYSPPAGGEGISPGSVMVIVFFVLIVVYLAGGVVFMVFVKKAQGKERIPNLTFWTALPGLIKDGVMFVIRRGAHKQGYTEM